MTVEYLAGKRVKGLSTDTKPTNVQNGTVFEETDTNKSFIFNSSTSTWTQF